VNVTFNASFFIPDTLTIERFSLVNVHGYMFGQGIFIVKKY